MRKDRRNRFAILSSQTIKFNTLGLCRDAVIGYIQPLPELITYALEGNYFRT